MSVQDKRICVGVITGAHGVRGAVRLKSFTVEPEDVARYGPLADERGERRFALRIVGNAKGVLIAAISGIEDRDRAEALRGLRLYLPRSALPPPDEEEYYHADLIGLEAALADGISIGTVRAVHDFGAGDTLEIERVEGQLVMVPFTRIVVPVVDLDAGRLVIDPPPGLLDEAAPKRRNPHPDPFPQAGEGAGENPLQLADEEDMGGGKRARRKRRNDSLAPALSSKGAREPSGEKERA